MEEAPLPNKASVIRLLLEAEGRVMVCLDATQKEVDVPRRFCTESGLMLVFNSTMPQPIHIEADTIASELRFGGIPHYCIIPYTAIWSVFNPDTNHGMVWPDSVPEGVHDMQWATQLSLADFSPEAFAQAERAAEVAPALARAVPVVAKKVPSFLRVIDGGGSPSDGARTPQVTQAPDPDQTTPKGSQGRRSHLRLVE